MEELYTLQREVGRGSYGVVFEGHVARSGERVAIKRLPCCSPESVELYLQELWAMRATARSHPNVIALHGCLLQTGPGTLRPLEPGSLPLDLVESALKGSAVARENAPGPRDRRSAPRDRSDPDPGAPPSTPRKSRERRNRRCLALWLVMEFCDGGDLNRYLLSGPPDPRRNRSVVRQLSRAVAFLHGLGITHRDLKPDNVLVRDTAGGPVVKVADFGLSKMGVNRGDAPRQIFSSTCGSEFYMAPEVWAGLSYSAQADIFSLGVLFWAVLERITFLEDGSSHEQLGAYVCRGRSGWLLPLGAALQEAPDLQICIPVRFRRAPPLPPPPGPATCRLLLDMLAWDPGARPPARSLEDRVRSALKDTP